MYLISIVSNCFLIILFHGDIMGEIIVIPFIYRVNAAAGLNGMPQTSARGKSRLEPSLQILSMSLIERQELENHDSEWQKLIRRMDPCL